VAIDKRDDGEMMERCKTNGIKGKNQEL